MTHDDENENDADDSGDAADAGSGTARGARPDGSPPPPARRSVGVTGALRAAAVPVAAGAAALFALSLYASTGAAGAPAARIEVTGGRLLLPSNPEATAAFFDLRNTGGSADTLLGVSSPGLGPAMLTRTAVAAGAGHMERVAGVLLRPGTRLAMTPYGTDVMVPDPRGLTLGERVTFDLRFAGSGSIRVRAVVVRPGG